MEKARLSSGATADIAPAVDGFPIPVVFPGSAVTPLPVVGMGAGALAVGAALFAASATVARVWLIGLGHGYFGIGTLERVRGS